MKTAVLSGLVLAVNAGDSIYGGAPAAPPAAPAPAPYDPKADVVPDTVPDGGYGNTPAPDTYTPPDSSYVPGGTDPAPTYPDKKPEVPAPVEEPVYVDKPATPIKDDEYDDGDDEYGVEKPVEKPTEVVDEYVPVKPSPSPQYPVDMPDDDDDYYGKPVPDVTKPAPSKPYTPIHDPPSQEKCGALYVDVLSEYFHYILSHIDQSIVDAIIELLQDLLDMVLNLDEADEDTVMKVVEQVKAVGTYAGDHLFDDETKYAVLDVIKKAQDTYGAIYKTSINPDVAVAWTSLWEPCHPSTPTPDETYAPLVDSYYQAYSSYMEDGATSPVYQEHIEKLCDSDDKEVKKYAEETKAAVMQLQSAEDAEDAVGDATDSGSGRVVAALSVVSSLLAMVL